MVLKLTMQSNRAIQGRFFGHVYGCPKQCYVLSCIIISIEHRIAVVTRKLFSPPATYMEAIRARFTCEGPGNNNQGNTIKLALVCKELSKLVKAPPAYFRSKLLSFLIGRESNVFQILNGDPFLFGFGQFNNSFTNGMIDNRSVCSLFPGKPFQELLSAFRAFGLNRTPNLLSFFSVFLKLFRIKRLSIADSGNINKPHINTYKFLNIFNIFIRDLNGLHNKKLSLFVHQIGLSFDVRKIIAVMANKWNLLTATNTPDRNNITWLIAKNPAIIRDGPQWSEGPFGFLVNFISIRHFGDTANKYLGRKLRGFFKLVIAPVMDLVLIKYFLFPYNIRHSIANHVRFFDRLQKRFGLFTRWQKLYFKRQFHYPKINGTATVSTMTSAKNNTFALNRVVRLTVASFFISVCFHQNYPTKIQNILVLEVLTIKKGTG